MPIGVYVRTEEHRNSHKITCKCFICKAKRREKHLSNCQCSVCKGIRGELSNKNSPMYGRKNEKSNVWKGDDAGYGGMHRWLRVNYGKASYCGNSNCSGKSKRFEWSFKKDHNIPYTRSREDYQQLCRKCHRNYDFQLNKEE